MFAASSGHLTMVQLLLADNLIKPSSFNYSVVSPRMERCYPEICELLKEWVDENNHKNS